MHVDYLCMLKMERYKLTETVCIAMECDGAGIALQSYGHASALSASATAGAHHQQTPSQNQPQHHPQQLHHHQHALLDDAASPTNSAQIAVGRKRRYDDEDVISAMGTDSKFGKLDEHRFESSSSPQPSTSLATVKTHFTHQTLVILVAGHRRPCKV